MASGWLDVQCHSLFLGGKLFFGQKTTIQRGNFLKKNFQPTLLHSMDFKLFCY